VIRDIRKIFPKESRGVNENEVKDF